MCTILSLHFNCFLSFSKAPVILTVAVSSSFVLTVTLETGSNSGFYQANLESKTASSIEHSELANGNIITVRNLLKNTVYSVTVIICEALSEPKICSPPSNSVQTLSPQSGMFI